MGMQKLRDISKINGVRSNPLVGYGLVVGLDGTGEQTVYTVQAFRTMLSRFGITLPPGLTPTLKNIAAVAIHAEMPPFVKRGQSIDVTVSSLGDAQSLRGGALLMTPLQGIDGKVYAIAQGNLLVGGFGAEGADGSKISVNIQTAGRIPNGAIIEREIGYSFGDTDHLTLNINNPDFTTAKRIADAINNLLGPDVARPLDPASVRVNAPRDVSQRVNFISVLENLEIDSISAQAKIVVNSRTGTIVIGKDVRVSPAAVTHGNLIVTIDENPDVVQPNPLANGQAVVNQATDIDVTQENRRMFLMQPGTSLEEIVSAVNAVGAAPGDLMAILEALKQAGALHGELVVI
ncbi:MAG: flagellar basal body P-ring protein FlgI [Pseudomonadota bacterium]